VRLPPAGPACPSARHCARRPACCRPRRHRAGAGRGTSRRRRSALLLGPTLTAADLHLEELGAEELTLLAAPHAADLYKSGHSGQELNWAQLAQQDVLLLEDGCSYSDDVARQLLAAGQPDSRRTRFGSVEAVKRCTAAGLGWTVLPGVTAAAELRAGALTALPGPLPSQPVVHLVTHPGRTPITATRLVLDHLRALWRPMP